MIQYKALTLLVTGMCAAALCASAQARRVAAPVHVAVVQSDAAVGQRLTRLPPHTFGRRRVGGLTISVIDSRRYQRFIGVGGAMTDSSAWLIWTQLPPARRTRLMDALFSPEGAYLGFLRVPVGASDFTAGGTPYTYDDTPPADSAAADALSGFSIAHDRAYILPALRDALRLNPAEYLEAVPWTMPPWMKANQTYNDPDGSGVLLTDDYALAAEYLVRFLQSYAQAGVPVQALSPADEPSVPTAIPSMGLSQQQESELIAADLLPALARAHLSPAIFGWDLSWGPLTSGDPLITLARQHRIGLAFHCYQGAPGFMTAIHYAAPAASQIVDECTTGTFDRWTTSEVMIASLRNWARAVAMWNLALDPAGGPVQPPNSGCGGCTGLATIAGGHYRLSADYYELAQLSRYVTPGARRIWSSTTVSYGLAPNYTTQVSPGVDDVAFLDPDGTRVLVAYNTATTTQTINVRWRGRYIVASIPAGATTTFTWQPAP